MAENDGIAIVGEGKGSTQSPELSRHQALEEKARQGGWKPEEEWDGDPTEWVSAGEFVRRGELFDKIKDLKNTIFHTRQSMQNDMKMISSHFAQMREAEYKRAIADLKAARREAMSDGDAEAVERIETRIDEVQQERQAVQSQVQASQNQGTSPVFEAWIAENSWYTQDKEMQADANEFAIGYAATHQGIAQEQLLQEVEKKIKKMYPEKFKKPTPPHVEGTTPSSESRTVGRPSSKIKESDLTFEEQKVMHALLNRGVLKEIAAKNKRSEKEEYLAQLALTRAKS